MKIVLVKHWEVLVMLVRLILKVKKVFAANLVMKYVENI
jgi:hypothetical protein